jgi:type I restriction enzyme, S subunit
VKAGWKLQRLGDLCAFDKFQGAHTNLPYVGLEHIESGTGQYLGNLEPTDVKSSTFKFNDSHVLYGRLRPYLNKVLLPDFEGHCSTEIFPIQIKPGLLREYLGHWLMSESVVESINTTCTGARMPRADMNAVLEFNIPVPSEQEQRRIVTLLDEAFADIATAKANAEKNLQNAHELFKSHLDEVLSSQASDHIATTLGTEVDLVAGFAFSSSHYSNNENDIRLLRGDNIMQGYLRWEDVKRWPMSDSSAHEKFALKEGDVVLAMDRPWVKAGLKRAQMTATDLPCLQVQRTARLRPKQNLSADFLFHLTGSQAFSRHLLDVQTGIGVPHISGAQIQDFKFMRPPLAKQAMIATELQKLQEETQRLESIYHQKLTALDDLKKSLLHQAFSGQL